MDVSWKNWKKKHGDFSLEFRNVFPDLGVDKAKKMRLWVNQSRWDLVSFPYNKPILQGIPMGMVWE